MVGKRTWATASNGADQHASKSTRTTRPRNTRHRTTRTAVPGTTNGSGENGGPTSPSSKFNGPRLYSYRDFETAEQEIRLNEERREELKDRLLKSVDNEDWERYRKSNVELRFPFTNPFLKAIKNKNLRNFYEGQNEKLNDWREVDAIVTALSDDVLESFDPDPDLDGIPERAGALQNVGEDIENFLPDDERKRRRKSARNARWAININVIANVLLLAAKIGAVFYSNSLSLIASLVDLALDLLCTLIIFSTNKLVQWRAQSLRARFPVGRRRLEPLGILVFSIRMIISFIQILQESFVKLFLSDDKTVVSLTPAAIGAMASTIGVKGLIWIGYVFFNTLSLIFPALGHKFNIWWLDPLGAALLSLFIIYDWGSTSFENVIRLSGTSADARLTRKIVFVAYRFESLVNGFKNVEAYHAGDGIWVEVEVLMDPDEKLVRCHDVAETLQYCLEGLSEVDRAFVTVDYTSLGPTGHSTTLL